MVPMDTGQDTDFNVNQMNFGSWLGNLGFNEPNKNYDSEAFNKTIEDYSGMVIRGEKGIGVSDEDSFAQYEKTSRERLEGYIFGPAGYWDDNAGTGSLSGHSEYLKTLIKQEKGDTHVITKQDIIDKAYELGRFGQQEDGSNESGPQFDFTDSPLIGATSTNDMIWNNNQFEGDAPGSDKNPNKKATYNFSGSGFNNDNMAIEVQLLPSELTLLTGDNNFSKLTSDKGFDSYGGLTSFTGSRFGIHKFYNGRAISEENYGNLTPEEKAEVSWETAIFGRVVLGGSKSDVALSQLGIKAYTGLASDDDNLYTNAIILASEHERSFTKKDTSNNTANLDLYNTAKAQAKQRNEELKAELAGNNTSNNNIDDPLGIL